MCAKILHGGEFHARRWVGSFIFHCGKRKWDITQKRPQMGKMLDDEVG